MSRLGEKADVSGRGDLFYIQGQGLGRVYLLLGVLQMALMRAMAEARLMAG